METKHEQLGFKETKFTTNINEKISHNHVQVIRAHKLILSACSPWFQKVRNRLLLIAFTKTKATCLMFSFLSQVILSLPAGPEAAIAIFDCPKSILRALLAFMYQGKVQVIGDKRKIFRNNSHDLIFPGAPRGPADLPQGG